MARLFCLFTFLWTAIAGPSFVPEIMPPFTTNRIFSITVRSNLMAFTVLEPPRSPGKWQEGAIYIRPRPAEDRAFQRIALPTESSTGEFGFNMTLQDGILIAKDGANTHFFKQEGDTWVPDGMISGEGRFLEAGGKVVVGGSFLISGSEVYEWPSRRYLQTLSPPTAGSPFYPVWNALFIGNKLAVTFPPEQYPGVWLFENVNGRWQKGEHLPEPEGTSDSRFGLVLGNFFGSSLLLVGAPMDDQGAKDSGAVHIYLGSAGGDSWFYHQKLKPALPTTGEQFGAAIATDSQRIYVSAPYRNEERQGAGAIFVYELQVIRSAISVVERAKVTLKDTVDHAGMGLNLAAQDRLIYTLVGSGIGQNPSVVAFHPPVQLTPSKSGEGFRIDLPRYDDDGILESVTELNAMWQEYPAAKQEWTLETPLEGPSRFFRMRSKPAF